MYTYHKNAHGNWQLSVHTLRVEKKPHALSSHDRRKLTSGLSKEGGSGGDQLRIDDFATMPNVHAPRVNRRTYRI